MNSYLQSFLAAIPAAATSKTALIAYALAVVAYILTMLRATRNRNLLTHINKFPAEDRLRALEAEMGVIRLPDGMTPEQWIKARLHTYYLISFAIATCVLLVILCLSFINRGSVDIFVGSAKSNQSKWMNTDFLVSSARADDESEDIRKIHYETARKDDHHLSIVGHLGYLEKIKNNEPIEPFYWSLTPFGFSFPHLTIQVVNNTAKTILLSSIVLRFKTSSIDNRPIPVITSGGPILPIRNEGWGQFENPALMLVARQHKSCDTIDLNGAISIPLTPSESYPGALDADIMPSVDDNLKKRSLACKPVHFFCSNAACTPFTPHQVDHLEECEPVCVQGVLQYTTKGQSFRNIFKAYSYLQQRHYYYKVVHASAYYGVSLTAGSQPHTKNLSISQAIAPGNTDNFEIIFNSDKSGDFSFDMDIVSANGEVQWTGSIELTSIVPRTGKPSQLPGGPLLVKVDQ